MCGGPERSGGWPRQGGLDAQDAGELLIFALLDGQVQAERARKMKALESQGGKK